MRRACSAGRRTIWWYVKRTGTMPAATSVACAASRDCCARDLAWYSQPSHSRTIGVPTIQKSTSSPATTAWNSNGGSP